MRFEGAYSLAGLLVFALLVLAALVPTDRATPSPQTVARFVSNVSGKPLSTPGKESR